jgi:hypothetical protein
MHRLVPLSRRQKKGHDMKKKIIVNTTIPHDPNLGDENEIMTFQKVTRNHHSRLFQIMLLYHGNIDHTERRKGLISLEEEIPKSHPVGAVKEDPPPN